MQSKYNLTTLWNLKYEKLAIYNEKGNRKIKILKSKMIKKIFAEEVFGKKKRLKYFINNK